MAENGKLQEILSKLTARQLAFISARLSSQSDKEAAKKAGIPSQTVYNWDEKEIINEAIRLAKTEALTLAREELSRLTLDAVAVLRDELSGKRGDKLRFDAAREVFDRAGLESTSKLDITSKGEQVGGFSDGQRAALIAAILERGTDDSVDA